MYKCCCDEYHNTCFFFFKFYLHGSQVTTHQIEFNTKPINECMRMIIVIVDFVDSHQFFPVHVRKRATSVEQYSLALVFFLLTVRKTMNFTALILQSG